MSHMLKSSDRKLKITMIDILGTSVEKVDKMHEQMVSFSRETKTMRNNQTEMLKLRKNMVTD